MGLMGDLIAPWLASERRSYWLGPFGSGDKALAALLARGPVTNAGVRVDERTALNISAVWAAVSMIAGAVATLPLFFYRRVEGGKEQYREHHLFALLHDRPNNEMGSFVFRELLTQHVLLWGNAYAEIQRDSGNRVVGLWPVTPDRVMPYRNDAGTIRYKVSNGGRRPDADLPADRMLHIRGLGFDGIQGYSVIGMARQSLGLTVAAEKFGAQFFGNGAHASLVAQHPNRMSEAAQKRFKESLKDAITGDNALSIVVLEEGIEIEKVSIPPDDAQFLETRKLQNEEISRWFNIPPHKIKDLERSTNNNIEQQAIEYVQDTLDPWLGRWKEELTRKLVSPLERGRQFFEFQVKGRLRGDTAAQTDHYARMFANGFYSIDEVRAFEGMNPLPNGLGQRHFIQGAMVPLDRIDELVDARKRPDDVPSSPVRAEFIQDLGASIVRALPEPQSLALPAADSDPDVLTMRDERRSIRERLEAVAVKVAELAERPRPDVEGVARSVIESMGAVIQGAVPKPPDPDPRVGELIVEVQALRAALPSETESDTLAAKITDMVTAALAPRRVEPEPTPPAPPPSPSRALLEWQYATIAFLVARMVRREVAFAKKLGADPDRADERIDAFHLRFQADALDDLRPWLTRAGTGVADKPIGPAIESWATAARRECLEALVSGTLPDLIRRWANGRADAKTAEIMGVLYGPATG